MEDLNSTLSSILGDPQKMEQLRQVAQSLGINPGAPMPQASQQQASQQFQQTSPQQAPQQFQQTSQQQASQPIQQVSVPASQTQQQPGASIGGFNPAAFAGMGEILKTFNQRDKNVELLQTLKPHFSPARADKIDDAVRIMQIIRAWPALRDSGMLGSLGNVFGGGETK